VLTILSVVTAVMQPKCMHVGKSAAAYPNSTKNISKGGNTWWIHTK